MTFDDSEDVLNLNHKDPILETVRESPVESVNPLSVFDDPPPVEDEAEEQVSPITSNESEEEAETKSIIGPAEDEDEEGTPAPSTVPANTGPPNGLAAGYTQAQLDEVKAFNAGLTKGRSCKRMFLQFYVDMHISGRQEAAKVSSSCGGDFLPVPCVV